MFNRNEDDAPQTIDRSVMEQLMFGVGRVRRFTQDSPVLPDVWLEYTKGPGERPDRLTSPTGDPGPFPPVKLLLTPFREAPTGRVRKELRERLTRERRTKEWEVFRHDPAIPPRLVYNQSTVAATLYFEDLVRAVLPMTAWWAQLDKQWAIRDLQTEEGKNLLAHAVQDPEHPPANGNRNKKARRHLPAGLLWMVRVVGVLALVHRREPLPTAFHSPGDVANATLADWRRVVEAVADLIRDVTLGNEDARIHSVSLNREATLAISRSMLAIKADAARRLFEISCKDLAWAVIDSGIDARHPAFRKRRTDPTRKDEVPEADAFCDETGAQANNTRIVATYDFTQIDDLLDPDTERQPWHVMERLAEDSETSTKLREQLEELRNALNNGRTLDWTLVAPCLRIPHQDGRYPELRNDHGTHVAGILAGDWRSAESEGVLEENLTGVCPDLPLYDLRVLDQDGRGDEFAVMAALQFVRHLNSTNDYVAVHGVNLSMSIRHDVANYACGRTPVCDECERVVSAGVVVVAAAGNQGYRNYATADGLSSEAYNSISITDPGNADRVITVGATHRFRPHTYGVSYFSSRGPTADGRSKPDLVAPGEKITAPIPNAMFALKDGTSMAAPHVSGAAALLMARHNELVGRPAEMKRILCEAATDLGRERYFQGAGMLDALRALQSV